MTNENAVEWIKRRSVTARTKHFETKLNFCRENYEAEVFSIEHIDGNKNPADLMTKQLGWQKIEEHCRKMGMFM